MSRAIVSFGFMLSAGTAQALDVPTVGFECTRENFVPVTVRANIKCELADTAGAPCQIHFETLPGQIGQPKHAVVTTSLPVSINRGDTVFFPVEIQKQSEPTDPNLHHYEVIQATVLNCINPVPGACSRPFGVYELRRPIFDPPCSASGAGTLDPGRQDPIFGFTSGTGVLVERSTNADAKFLYHGFADALWGTNAETHLGNFSSNARRELVRYNTNTGDVQFYQMNDEPFNHSSFSSVTQVFSSNWGPNFRVFAADLSGDGRDEVFRYSPSTGQAIMTTYSAGLVQTEVYNNMGWGIGWEMHFANLNSDAKLEILRYNRTTGQIIITSMATHTHSNRFNGHWWGSGQDLFFANLNNDADKETIAFDPATGVVVLTEWSENLFSRSNAAFDNFGTGVQIHVGNMDSDARDEVVLFWPTLGNLAVLEGSIGIGLLPTFTGRGWGVGYQLKIGNVTGQEPERVVRYDAATGHILVTQLFPGSTPAFINSINQLGFGLGHMLFTKNRSYYRNY
jgi:hypothetical protein